MPQVPATGGRPKTGAGHRDDAMLAFLEFEARADRVVQMIQRHYRELRDELTAMKEDARKAGLSWRYGEIVDAHVSALRSPRLTRWPRERRGDHGRVREASAAGPHRHRGDPRRGRGRGVDRVGGGGVTALLRLARRLLDSHEAAMRAELEQLRSERGAS